MESKYTKGPWHRNIVAKGKYPVVFSDRNNHVAVVKQAKSNEETEANISLISAAPDLLEALQFCKSVIQSQGLFDLSERMAFDKADAAIKKATD